MIPRFKSQSQGRLFAAVLAALRNLGYSKNLLVENYKFPDHFSTGKEVVNTPAAAFGEEPHDPNSACLAVVLANGRSGAALIGDYRALGAPYAIEVDEGTVVHWRVAPHVTDCHRLEAVDSDDLSTLFQRNESLWSPSSILRAKNIVARTGQRQLDFIDAGLLPALETHIREKLDPLLRDVLFAAKSDYKRRNGNEPNADCGTQGADSEKPPS